MAYNVTGGAGNDTLNQSSDSGPGTIVGLAGDDSISTGNRACARSFGNSGNDTVVLQAGNTGTVNGGTENDSIFQRQHRLDAAVRQRRRRHVSTSAAARPRPSSAAMIRATARTIITSRLGGGRSRLRQRRQRYRQRRGRREHDHRRLRQRQLFIHSSGNDLVFGNQGNDIIMRRPATTPCSAGWATTAHR